MPTRAEEHRPSCCAACLLPLPGDGAAVFDARARLAQPPPAGTGRCAAPPANSHAKSLERLRQLCELHRDSSHKALRDVAREFLNDWDVIVRPLEDPRLPLN